MWIPETHTRCTAGMAGPEQDQKLLGRSSPRSVAGSKRGPEQDLELLGRSSPRSVAGSTRGPEHDLELLGRIYTYADVLWFSSSSLGISSVWRFSTWGTECKSALNLWRQPSSVRQCIGACAGACARTRTSSSTSTSPSIGTSANTGTSHYSTSNTSTSTSTSTSTGTC